MQNLAKDRAASFGKKGEIKMNGYTLQDDRPEIFHSPSNTVVVTMPHDHPESNGSHKQQHIEMDDQKALNEPRGFFADQFEVSTICGVLLLSVPGFKGANQLAMAT